MADETPATGAVDSDKPWGEEYCWIVKDELAAINTRRNSEEARRLQDERDCRSKDPFYDSEDPFFKELPFRKVEYHAAENTINVVGLALSGGGIRSSAICLGVLQALNQHNLIRRIDYLSTVSGGGYIGSSLTATMTKTKEFVFGKAPVAGSGAESASEVSDTPAVGHLRNYSNYLIPAGTRDLLTGIAIVVRGLVANFSLTLPVVLVLAAVTIWSTPMRSCLAVANLFGMKVGADEQNQCVLHHVGWIDHYGFTLVGILLALVLLAASGIVYRFSRSGAGKGPSIFLIYLAGMAFAMGLICDFARFLHVKNFALTLATALFGLLLFFFWALKQSFASPRRLQEFRGHLPTVGATFLVLLAVIGFFEFQPFMIAEMFDTAESGATGGVVAGVAIGWVKALAAIAAPIAGVVTVFRQQFAEFLKGSSVSSEIGSLILSIVAKAAIWIAGAALPLIIWVGYLYLSFWGIANDPAGKCSPMSPPSAQSSCAPENAQNAPRSLTGKIQFDSKASTFSAEIVPQTPVTPPSKERAKPTSHAPGWLVSLAGIFGQPDEWSKEGNGYIYGLAVVVLYAVFAVLLFGSSWLLKPNANSLHRLYRDRLSKAFLFDPRRVKSGDLARTEASLAQGHDFLPLDRMKLSELSPVVATEDAAAEAGDPVQQPAAPVDGDLPRKLEAPYHLINTALNIQGSDYANRRGRNADFFLFSPLHIGSEATRYAKTKEFEEKMAPGLDLATAMAISGAAASSNMGSSSIKALAPTLALLNVRLGYWLANPRYVNDVTSAPQHRSTPLFLWSEITGRLYENADAVYLTDGGHIENLGVYELLRRRCKVIIAVDAEADAPMNFSSLMTLQRYARIDLGILINLPWTPIRTDTLAWMNCNAGKSPPPAPVISHGPHVAIGTIDYGGGEKGYLVYIKSSLTGDENDYIRDYARRNDRFPHETTGDQFFSEEQFEVYRALGFHMTHEFLSGDDELVVAVDGKPPVTTNFNAAGVASIDAVRAALGFPAAVPPPGNPASGVSELS